jgi:hypothetical protein
MAIKKKTASYKRFLVNFFFNGVYSILFCARAVVIKSKSWNEEISSYIYKGFTDWLILPHQVE